MHILDGPKFPRATWDPYCFVHRHKDPQPVDKHHVWPLSEGGPDVKDNLVALCPNGHRRVHEYLRLLKKHDGKVPWLKRKLFGHRVRYVGQTGYEALKAAQIRALLAARNYDPDTD